MRETSVAEERIQSLGGSPALAIAIGHTLTREEATTSRGDRGVAADMGKAVVPAVVVVKDILFGQLIASLE
jgi:hypothetical protein